MFLVRRWYGASERVHLWANVMSSRDTPDKSRISIEARAMKSAGFDECRAVVKAKQQLLGIADGEARTQWA